MLGKKHIYVLSSPQLSKDIFSRVYYIILCLCTIEEIIE